jgi:hypothetical protein
MIGTILIVLLLLCVLALFVCMILVIMAVDAECKRALREQEERWKWLDDLKEKNDAQR